VSQHAAGKIQCLKLRLNFWSDPVVDARYKAAWLRKHNGLIQGVQSLRYDCAYSSYYDATPGVAMKAERLLLDALEEAGPLSSLREFSSEILGAPIALGFLPSTLDSVSLAAFCASGCGTWSDDSPQSIADGLAAVTGLQPLSLVFFPELEACLPQPDIMASWPQLTSVMLRSSDRITPGLVRKLGHMPQSVQKLTLWQDPDTFSEHFQYTVSYWL
jgi:hypothetical protein